MSTCGRCRGRLVRACRARPRGQAASSLVARAAKSVLDLELECERLTEVTERLAEENERLRETNANLKAALGERE